MSKNRLIHVTSSLQMGGAERTLFNIVKHLRHQFDQTVIYFHGGPFVSAIEQLGVRTIKINGLFCLYDPVFFWRLFKVIKQCDPDLVHSLLWAANVSSRLCAYVFKKPIVNVYHNNVDQDGTFRQLLDRLTGAMCNYPVAVSEQVAQSIKHYWQPAKKIEVITNGIEAPDVMHVITKADLGISEDSLVIGAVGRFVSIKSFDFLLKSAAKVMKTHVHVHVVLLGCGEQEAFLRQLVKDLCIDDKVHFVVGKSAIDYYPLFDCFVQSSAKEGVSLALLEAMHFGLPCIVMGEFFVHPVVLHGVDGLVSCAGDMDQLAQNMDLVLQNKQVRIRLGQKAQKIVNSRFSLQNMISQYEKLFSTLCNKNTK